jgi:hypothetical protein
MATQTVYGTIMIRGDNAFKTYDNSDFRLHIGRRASPENTWYYSLPRDFGAWITHAAVADKKEIIIRLKKHPSPDTIYTREVHVCKNEDSEGNEVFHFKEGSHFMATRKDSKFIKTLSFFLSKDIPEVYKLMCGL